MSDEKGARVVTDGPTMAPPAPKTASASAPPLTHDAAWAVDRLRILISQTLSSDEYRELTKKWNSDSIASDNFNARVAAMVAEKCGDDKVLIDAMEASLIPGLRDVNDELAKFGKVLCAYMNGNRLSKFELQDKG